MSVHRSLFAFAVAMLVCPIAAAAEGASVVNYYGYDDCIRLSNQRVQVVLCPSAGGRVLEYSLDGINSLYLPAGDEGWRYEPGGDRGNMNAGRFDIGPEKVVQRGSVLWMGAWEGEITSDRSARLTSQFDAKSGARLIRDFQLDPSTSHLRCRQTIINESDEPISLCHWSRTFAVGGGVAIVPRSSRGRFPNGYVMYEPGNAININPNDPNIHVTDQAVVVSGPPAFPKLGFDSHTGWLAYAMPSNQLFVKRFATYPERAYNEVAGLTISVWYPESDRVELEPIGPAENLDPGDRASFTEEWWLVPHDFPQDPHNIDVEEVRKKVMQQTLNDQSVPASRSPIVHQDGSVTFQFVGNSARDVRVTFDGHTHSMLQNDSGVWMFRSQPSPPGIYQYTFDVDGVRVTDPRNRWVKKWKICASLVEIPGDPPQLTERQGVPHGTTHRHLYASRTSGRDRAAVVYTPPGYESTAAPYPMVVLCHGSGDDETAWTEVGRAHLILDNLIADGAIDPMIVVMPNGHPIPYAERDSSDDYSTRNTAAMYADVVEDLLPLVEKHYNVAEDAAQRAIVGLSMGGGQSITIGMKSEQFGWIGAFSASTPSDEDARDLCRRYDSDRVKLFWIACGIEDSLIERNRSFDRTLSEHGISHTYVETQGGHSWPVWRDYLPTFLQTLFRGPTR